MPKYGDFGAGGYSSLVQLPALLSPSLPSLSLVKPPTLITSNPINPSLSLNDSATADRALGGLEAGLAVVSDQADNQALGAISITNPVTGI